MYSLQHTVHSVCAELCSLDKGSGFSRRDDMEKSVDEMQSELDKLLASTNLLDLGIDLNDPAFLNVRV